MSRHKTITVRKVVSLILAFLIFMALAVSLLSVELWMGFCSEGNVSKSFNRTNYQGKAYKQLESDISGLMKVQGIPPRIALSVISEKRFNVDSGNCYKSAMQGKSELVSTEAMSEDLTANIERYFKKENVKINGVLRTAIDETVNTAGKYYKEHASFKFGKYFVEYRQDIANIFIMLLPVSVVIAAILALIVIRINPYRHRGARYLVYSLLSASVLSLIVGGMLYYSNPIDISAASGYYKDFAEMFVRDSLIPCFVVGGVGVILSLIFAGLIARYRRKAKKHVH